VLHSDRGGEYLSRAVRTVLDQKGIKHKLTMPGSPQQNSLAKQWNHTLLDKAHALLHGTGLSLSFWEYAIDTAVHTYNRTPTHTIGWHTPHELWNMGHVLDVSYFRIFGCKAFVYVPEDKRKKLDPKVIEMMLIGYELGSKGYRLWNSSTQAIILSHDVMFDKCSFPSKESSTPSALPSQPTVLDGPVTITLPASEPGGPAPQPELNTLAQCPLPEMPQHPLLS
jgi:hypothetical protein